jgi:hypothetical protein
MQRDRFLSHPGIAFGDRARLARLFSVECYNHWHKMRNAVAFASSLRSPFNCTSLVTVPFLGELLPVGVQ